MATKTKTKNNVKSEKSNAKSGGGATTVVVAKTAMTKSNGLHEHIYEDAVKEIVALGENDTYAKKIDNGPLNEARGKDTWRLHTQLRAVDQLDKNLARHVESLVDNQGNILNQLESTRDAVQKWITSTHSEVGDWVTSTKESVNKNVTATRGEITEAVEALHKSTKEWFTKLAQATAGSEENLKNQTDSFSKAVENLLGSLQHEFDKKITEFRDESTRLVDKRFNQADVAFAAIRADQEVIKALLTDIIKDRMGRSDARIR